MDEAQDARHAFVAIAGGKTAMPELRIFCVPRLDIDLSNAEQAALMELQRAQVDLAEAWIGHDACRNPRGGLPPTPWHRQACSALEKAEQAALSCLQDEGHSVDFAVLVIVPSAGAEEALPVPAIEPSLALGTVPSIPDESIARVHVATPATRRCPETGLDALQRAMRLSTVAISYWDREGTCWYANAACSEWLPFDGSQLPGMYFGDLVRSADLPLHVEHMDAALRGDRCSLQQEFQLRQGVRHGLVQFIPDTCLGVTAGFVLQVCPTPRELRLNSITMLDFSRADATGG